MRIRIKDLAKLQPDKMAKIALAATPRALLDLYCVAPGQEQKAHTHGDQTRFTAARGAAGPSRLAPPGPPRGAGTRPAPPPGSSPGPPTAGARRPPAPSLARPPPPP